MVYVLNKNMQPLMPTNRHGKVKYLLKNGKAKVIKRCPFTIQLLYSSTNYTQSITLGVDAGSKHIGLSATTKTKELYASDVELRNDIVDLLSTRNQNRRTRRSHKTRYRNVHNTYGYITKNTRVVNGLPKDHYIDARCISGNPLAEPLDVVYYQKKVRCHNRQIHKSTILKGGYRKRNQANFIVKGFRLFDKVKYQSKEYFIFGRRNNGFFDIRTLDGTKVNKGSINCKKLQFIRISKHYLIEIRKQLSSA